MADKSSLIIETTDYANNNPNQITISNVVPGADSTKLKTWAQMTAALSKDRYVKSTRIDRIELDTDSRPDRTFAQFRYIKKNPTTSGSLWLDPVPDNWQLSFPYDELYQGNAWTVRLFTSLEYDSVPRIKNLTTTGQATISIPGFNRAGIPDGYWEVAFSVSEAEPNTTITGTIYFPPTANLKAWSQDFSITLTGGE